MPAIVDRFIIGSKKNDKRIKLQDSDKDRIFELHKKGVSIHSLSKSFGVARRLIQFLLFPERKEKNLQDRKKRGGSKIYYKTEYNTKQMSKHRKYKKELHKKGELKNA